MPEQYYPITMTQRCPGCGDWFPLLQLAVPGVYLCLLCDTEVDMRTPLARATYEALRHA